MNDLVSEYQQYQDATAEGKVLNIFPIIIFLKIIFLFLQKKVKVVKKKANKKVPKSANKTKTIFFIIIGYENKNLLFYYTIS